MRTTLALICLCFLTFVYAQEKETWFCDSVLTTGVRQNEDKWESFSTSGDDWKLVLDGVYSIMTRLPGSDFTIRCEKRPFVGHIVCTGPNGVTVNIDVRTGTGALSDMLYITAGAPAEEKALFCVLSCVKS